MATPTFILPSAPTYTEGFVNGLNVYPNPTNFVANQVPFTRATTATRTNAAGLIELTPYNLLQYSEMFSNVAWTKNNSSIAANIITAPNGTLTADKLVEDTSNAVHNVLFSLTPTITTYSISFYAKKAERNFAAFYFGGASWGGQGFIVNLTTGEVTTNTTGATPIITLLPDGWVKIEASRAATTAIQIQFQVFTALNASTISYTGDGTSGIFIWGAQLVEGTSALPYQLTETRLNRPRVDFSLGGCPNLLLEPQRTNLAVNSVWSGGGVNPTSWNLQGTGGTTTPVSSIKTNLAAAYRFQVNSQRRFFTQFISVTSGVTYSFSIYVESVVDSMTISNMLNCFALGSQVFTREGVTISPIDEVQAGFRYTLTGVASSTTLIEFRVGGGVGGVDIADVTLSMPQLEAGAYPTSYIPTTSASVTRNQDSFALSNVFTNNMISSAGGTWFMELRNNIPYTPDSNIGAIFLDTASFGYTDGFMFRKQTSGRFLIQRYIGTIGLTLHATTTDTVKVAIKWNGTTADVFVNGVKVVAATAFAITAMQFLSNNANPLYANINNTALYNTPISDAECIAITTL
jgi:hypothetical protein